jgi:hypothetical protein
LIVGKAAMAVIFLVGRYLTHLFVNAVALALPVKSVFEG